MTKGASSKSKDLGRRPRRGPRLALWLTVGPLVSPFLSPSCPFLRMMMMMMTINSHRGDDGGDEV